MEGHGNFQAMNSSFDAPSGNFQGLKLSLFTLSGNFQEAKLKLFAVVGKLFAIRNLVTGGLRNCNFIPLKFLVVLRKYPV
jgi:hypothetical protein